MPDQKCVETIKWKPQVQRDLGWSLVYFATRAGDIATRDNWCGAGTYSVKMGSTPHSVYSYYLLSTYMSKSRIRTQTDSKTM